MANNNNTIENLKGTWDFVSGENFESILKELGVNLLIRTFAKNSKPRVTIDEKDGKWSFKSETTFNTISYQFTPGVEFEDKTPDGQLIQITIIFENGEWIQTTRYKSGKEMNIKRWINDKDQLQSIITCGKVEATQLYRRTT